MVKNIKVIRKRPVSHRETHLFALQEHIYLWHKITLCPVVFKSKCFHLLQSGSRAVCLKKRSWAKLSTYFNYPPAIRRLIYSTNANEGFHRQIRKVTKDKGLFTSDMTLLKLIYLVTDGIQEQWRLLLVNWSICAS